MIPTGSENHRCSLFPDHHRCWSNNWWRIMYSDIWFHSNNKWFEWKIQYHCRTKNTNCNNDIIWMVNIISIMDTIDCRSIRNKIKKYTPGNPRVYKYLSSTLSFILIISFHCPTSIHNRCNFI